MIFFYPEKVLLWDVNMLSPTRDAVIVFSPIDTVTSFAGTYVTSLQFPAYGPNYLIVPFGGARIASPHVPSAHRPILSPLPADF